MTKAGGVQAFNWESWRTEYYQDIKKQSQWFAEMGFTYVWLPPSVASVSEQGYMPNDYFNLNSHYGSEEELIGAIKALKEAGLRVAGDCVLNHRCALHQDANGVYNQVRLGACLANACYDRAAPHGQLDLSAGRAAHVNACAARYTCMHMCQGNLYPPPLAKRCHAVITFNVFNSSFHEYN